MKEIVEGEKRKDRRIFISSIFFVLGFSFVFSIVGVILQTALVNVSDVVQIWLGRAGGVVIIIFGLFLLGLFTPNFLKRAHNIRIEKRSRSTYLNSFIFGAAFAVGWTPCVTAALGAILALATTSASSAFILLMSYTLGIGLPFLLVGLFTNQAEGIINKYQTKFKFVQYIFGLLLIFLGILVFTGKLNVIANFEFVAELVGGIDIQFGGGGIDSLSIINFGIAFLAGLVSFLSPCILPLIPGYLSFLAQATTNKNESR